MKTYIMCLPLLTAKIQHQYIKQEPPQKYRIGTISNIKLRYVTPSNGD